MGPWPTFRQPVRAELDQLEQDHGQSVQVLGLGRRPGAACSQACWQSTAQHVCMRLACSHTISVCDVAQAGWPGACSGPCLHRLSRPLLYGHC